MRFVNGAVCRPEQGRLPVSQRYRLGGKASRWSEKPGFCAESKNALELRRKARAHAG